MNHKKKRVVITGVGAVSPVGKNANELWHNLLKGKSGIRNLAPAPGIDLSVTTGGQVFGDLYSTDRDDIQVSPTGQYHPEKRHIAIGESAIQEALQQSNLDPADSGFIWSTGLDMFNLIEDKYVIYRSTDIFDRLASSFGGPAMMVSAACASSTQSVGEAYHKVSSGLLERCVAGGSSAILSPFYLLGFSAIRAIAEDMSGEKPEESCRPFDRTRRGFALSDGAGALVLESYESATKRSAKILATVTGYGTSQDAYDFHRPPAGGDGAVLCMQRALAGSGISANDIQCINAHATGTRAGDIAEARAIQKVFVDKGNDVVVHAIKGSIGHTMSASGSLELVTSVFSCLEQMIPHTVNLTEPDTDCKLNHVMDSPIKKDIKNILSTSFGMGGQNAGVVISRLIN